MIERRYNTEAVDVRAGSGKVVRVMHGYAATYNKRSKPIGGVFEEVLLPGAFRGVVNPSIDEPTVALWMHDELSLLASTINGELRLEDDSKGLRQETDLLGDTSVSKDVIAHLDAKRINSMSFAFRSAPKTDEWRRENGVEVRYIHQIARLKDVSPVIFPAYGGTEVGIRAVEGGVDFVRLSRLIIRAENGLDMTRTDLDELKEYRSMLDKYIGGTPSEAEKDAPAALSWEEAKRRYKMLF